MEFIVVGWIYRGELHIADMYTLTGELYNRYWIILWKFLGPIFLSAILIVQFIVEFIYPLEEVHNHFYPWWAKLIGVIEIAIPFILSLYIFIKAHQVREADLWGPSSFQLEQELEKDFAIGDSLLPED